MNDFSESSLRTLLEAIQDRASSFIDHMNDRVLPHDNPIYLRFDIDNDFRKAYQMSCICNEYGIRGTFFILNTAPYWNDPEIWPFLRVMQSKGHEIGWHNNVLTEWYQWKNNYQQLHEQSDETNLNYIKGIIKLSLERFRGNEITVHGSASHGDPLCRKLSYINYEVFTECPRTEEATGFPSPKFIIPQVSMHDFGLEYEAYHVPYDLYLSESGGREWTWRVTGIDGARPTDMQRLIGNIKNYERIQILIHPQHWKI